MAEQYVLEIGPGIGTMTQYLCEKARQVVAVEVDQKLIPVLEETLSGNDNVMVLNEDVLKVDIIMGLFEAHVPLESITVMVQKEVAERMQAAPGTKEYGALSLAVQYYAKAEVVANVPPNCFMPRPKVGSAVIRLTCHKDRPVTVSDEAFLFRVVRASFNQRRKTLVNGLGNDAALGVTKEQAVQALEKMGLQPDVRSERLSLQEFAQLSNLLL